MTEGCILIFNMADKIYNLPEVLKNVISKPLFEAKKKSEVYEELTKEEHKAPGINPNFNIAILH